MMHPLQVRVRNDRRQLLRHIVDRHIAYANQLRAQRLRVLRPGACDEDAIVEPAECERKLLEACLLAARSVEIEACMLIARQSHELRQPDVEFRVAQRGNLALEILDRAREIGLAKLKEKLYM